MQKLKTTFTILFFLSAIISIQAQERIEKTYTGIESIRLTTASGNGTIKKSNTNEVKVTVEYTYDEDDFKPKFEQSGSRLFIEEDFRRSRWTNGRAEWTLEIPDGLVLDFKTGSGNIEVDGLEIELSANTGSGNIDIRDIQGEMRANTGSGNITLYDINANMDANTGSGSIRIEDAMGDADFNTGSGNIRVRTIEGKIRLNTGSGNIDVQAASITGSSSLNTGSGNAQVELASQLDYDLSVNTGSGNAILDFSGRDIAGEFYMRAQGEGDISAPFRFDKEYKEEGSGWRGRGYYVKEAKIGSKNIKVRISTGSGRAVVRK